MADLPDDVRVLVERCLGGDQAAMAALVERFQGLVFGLCLRMLGHRHDAEDVTQDSFVRFFKSLKRWDNTRELRPWLLAIAANRCRTFLGARKKRPQPIDAVDQVPDKTPSQSPARHLAEEVQLALVDLRQEYRTAFLLFHEQYLSYDEIAESMNIPLGTVKTWVHRARRELADRLRQRGAVEELTRDA